jgi:hypothetical protein
MLESNGFETKGKYILSTRSFGVPTTFMLLIMRDAMEQIKTTQDEISNLRKKLSSEPLTDLSKFKITSQKQVSTAFDYWEVPILDNTPASGCPMIITCNVLSPIDSKIDLTKIYSTVEPNINIYKSAIQIKTDATDSKDTVAIHKNVILFLEFSYALSERVEHEAKTLSDMIKKTITLPLKGEMFGKNCERRGSIIHSSFLNLSIVPEDASITLGKGSSLIDAVTQGFEEACNWVDSIYAIMLATLQR